MVLNSESNNPNPPSSSTTPTNPLPPPSLSQTMVTPAPFYLNPQIPTFSQNLITTNNFGWTGNQPSLFSNYVGMNPIQHVGSSSNQVENLTRPILQLGLGPYPSLSETHLSRNTFFRFGSETNQNENTRNSLLQLGSNMNRDQTKNNSFLQLGSSSILRDENKHVLDLGHGSSSNRDENKDINSNSNLLKNRGINPDLKHALWSDPIEPVSETEKKEISLVLSLGSSPNMVDNIGTNLGSNKIDNKGINPGLDRVQQKETSGFKFCSLALDPAKPISGTNKNETSLVLGQSSSLNRVENRGINSDPIQFDKILELCNLALDSVEPISEKEVVEKNPNQLDLIKKGKSKVSIGSLMKAKGLSENNNAGEGDKEDEEKVGTKCSDEEPNIEKVGTECSDEEPNTPLVKTWNLRPRKPRVNLEKQGINESGGGGSKPRSASKSRPQSKVERPVMEKRELVISLTKKEIEHDFILMTGEKPPKKPNKRSKAVQKNLDELFPGMHLTNITSERYKNVHDNTHL